MPRARRRPTRVATPPVVHPHAAGIDLNAPSDLRALYQAAVARGERLPVAFAVGSHPADFLAAVAATALGGAYRVTDDIADSFDFVSIEMEHANGVVYAGTGTVMDEVQASSQNATATIKVGGPGKLESQ